MNTRLPRTTDPAQRHALTGTADDTTISQDDWPAWSAGYEAGLRDGIRMSDLRISVELVPVGPAIAGLKLWKAMTQARLNPGAVYRRPALSARELRARALASWRAVDPAGRGRRVHP